MFQNRSIKWSMGAKFEYIERDSPTWRPETTFYEKRAQSVADSRDHRHIFLCLLAALRNYDFGGCS